MNPLDNIRIVLINTQFGGNIGAVARAMKNMGLSRLYLINPEQFPDKSAYIRAAHATEILEQAIILTNLAEAIADCKLVIGTSTRERGFSLPMLTARECGEKLINESVAEPVALVFGQESSGLSSKDLKPCNYQGYIPANPAYSSLNLGAAVQTFCYEIFQASEAAQPLSKAAVGHYPDNQQSEFFYQHLEKVLYDVGFILPRHPGNIMKKLRGLFKRARPDEKELNILRGVLSAVERKVSEGDNR